MDRLGGLDGTVVEGGRNLSERDRILCAIVRARLARPGLWLIDNVSSFLGAECLEKLRGDLCGDTATILTVKSANELSAEAFLA